MSKQTKRWSELAGLPKKEKAKKVQLDENIGGIVGIPALNNPLERKKEDFELAFEHYIGEHIEGLSEKDEDEIMSGDPSQFSANEGEEEDGETYVRKLINALDGANTELKEALEDTHLRDEDGYSDLYSALEEIETQITNTQEKMGWI